MRVVEITYKKPANLFVDDLQKYCMTLMAQPEQHGINSLKDVESKIWEYAKMQQAVYPRCKMDDLEVISDSSIIREWYNLLYKGEKSMITISARPDAYEKCFRDLDQ